ncbi:MAG: GNAT family N-acetyltransferase [Tatlockia sp.]|jgi:RimJ/RimL family protein N-acetyltransferase
MFEDKEAFLAAMLSSNSLHHPWVEPPATPQAFDDYWKRFQQPNQKSYLVCDELDTIFGVFNVNEIVRGAFQSAFLGFYGIKDYTGKGYMRAGLKLVQKKVFETLGLHRLEANIQPENTRSIQLGCVYNSSPMPTCRGLSAASRLSKSTTNIIIQITPIWV